MKTIEYFPLYLKDIREFKIISNLEDEEIEKIKKQVEKLLQEAVVVTAESYGLQRYEKIYNINNTSDDVVVRRFNIISKINNRAPFTLKWLDNKLKQLVRRKQLHNKYRLC